MRQHHDELVAAVPAHKIAGTNPRGDPRCHRGQNFVAGGMTVLIVDGFEAVQIDEQQADALALLRSLGNGGVEQLLHAPAVIEARESVAVGKPQGLCLALPEGGQFTHQTCIGGTQCLQFAILVAGRRNDAAQRMP